MKVLSYITACLVAVAIHVQAADVLCIGLDKYADYSDLKCAENDAAQMASILKEQGHNTTLLTSHNVTRERVLGALKNQSTIVYFAGHGEKEHLVLADGAISLKELAARSSIILLDCCYIGKGLRDTGDTRVLAAAQYEAFEADGHGIFTKYLLKWLTKGKPFPDNHIFDYINKSIKTETGGWQKPVLGYI